MSNDRPLNVQKLIEKLYTEKNRREFDLAYGQLMELVESGLADEEIAQALGFNFAEMVRDGSPQSIFKIANARIPRLSVVYQNKIRDIINELKTVEQCNEILKLPKAIWLDKARVKNLKIHFRLDEDKFEPWEFDKLYRIIEITPTELHERLIPNKLSKTGFLGVDEEYEKVVSTDLATLESIGVSHTDFAKLVSYVLSDRIVASTIRTKRGEVQTLRIGGLFRKDQYYRGYQLCPFTMKQISISECEFLYSATGKAKMAISGGMPYLIRRFAFFEGKSVPHRLDPKKFLNFFRISKPNEFIQNLDL